MGLQHRASQGPPPRQIALPLLAVSCIVLLAAALWPRAGGSVMLVLPPGVQASGAFSLPGWRVQSLGSRGPFAIVHASPETSAESPLALLRATGAWLVTTTVPRAGCTPTS
jgi:hypothetical protein